MHIQNKLASILYKAVLVVLCAAGILLNSGFPGRFSARAFMYYTIQSNLLCLVFFVAALVYACVSLRRRGPRGAATLLPHFKGAVTIAITVTMLIYQFILAPTPFSMGGGGGDIGNQLVHLFVPLMVILDWLLFDPKGAYRAFDPLLWCVIPLLYFGYTLVAAQLGAIYYGGTRYPYAFINVDIFGLGQVLLHVLVLLGVFLALNYAIFGLDRWMAAVAGKRRQAQ